MMGSPTDEKNRRDDENRVLVTLTKGFWLGKHGVTQGEWHRLMHTTPWSGKADVKNGDDYPASYVSWEDAMEFCEKLTAEEHCAGRLPLEWQYNLPTEAQWEYSCRAGTETRFSFGDDESQLSEYAWWGGLFGEGNAKNEQYAHKAGQKTANAWGLRDMHGNTWDWCRDRYAKHLTGGADPLGSPEGSLRVGRGGCWGSGDTSCRSAIRGRYTPDDRFGYLGFRLAAVLCGT